MYNMLTNMKSTRKVVKSFTLDRDLLREIEATRNGLSASERLNRLVRLGLVAERQAALHDEAAEFFRSQDDRTERRAFQSASIRSLSREP